MTLSAFPTACMYIRSPAIDTEADSIFYVATDGGAYISDYISTYSYGSPYTGRDDSAWQVDHSADVGFNYGYDGVYGSYGTNTYLSGHELFKRCMEYFKFW